MMSQQISPERLPVRRVRDPGALLFMFAFLGFLAYIIWDGLYTKETDVNLIVHGHDSFGNICGRNNKPIRFSEKSGRNYSDKPYTKYTLINSQFERYTSRVKFGELVYVKEVENQVSDGGPSSSIERPDGWQKTKSQDRWRKQTSHDKDILQAAASFTAAPTVLNVGTRGGSTWQHKTSTSTRNELASSSRTGATATTTRATTTTTTTTTLTSKREAPRELQNASPASTAKQANRIQFNGRVDAGTGAFSRYDSRTPRPQDLNGSDSGSNDEDANGPEQQAQRLDKQNLSRQRRSATAAVQTLTPQTQLPGVHFDLVGLARTNRSLLNALRSSMMYQYPPMYGYSDSTTSRRLNGSLATSLDDDANGNGSSYESNSPQVRAYEADSSAMAKHRQSNSPNYANAMASQRPVVFDAISAARLQPTRINEQQQNETSDQYDHMLVTPMSVATQRLRPALTNNNDNKGLQKSPTTSVISQQDVTDQLLYLTECVSSCPKDHVELIFHRCMPNNWRFSLFPNAINVTRTFVDEVLTDVSHCYREIIYTFSLSLVLSLSLLILLRFLASIIIWSCLVVLILIFISMASYSWLTFYQHITDLDHIMPHESAYADKLASSDKWLIGSIFLTFIAFATIGTVLFMRKRILMVTMLFRESGKAIADMPLLLLQPLLTFAALCGIMTAWLAGLVILQSMKVPVVDMHTGFVVFRAETLYKLMKWYHIFAFLWVSHFAIACQHYVIGASVSKWYFSPNRYQLSSPIGTSISELILYYMGSVALGSFLVAIFKVVRVITRQVQFLMQRSCMSPPLNANQAMGGGGGGNSESNHLGPSSSSTCGSLGYVWRLFIWFFDNIVMIINRDAYVEIAIHGHSFLSGARRAFTVLASNPLRLLAIKSVGNILLVMAKICVVVGTVSMAYVLLEGKTQQLNYSWSPIVISAVFAYVVAHWFLSVYEMVIDAMFICYCEDFEQKNFELNRLINGSTFRAQILNNGQIY